jgi:hypothetical protein
MSTLPVACTLSPDDLRQRRAGLLAGLAATAKTRETIESGMRFTFEASSENFADVMKAIDAERRCCQFLQFELTVTPGLGPFTLTITGPAGTAEFLSALFTT